MKITLELGVPYRDFVGKNKFDIETKKEKTIGDVMEAFLVSHPSLLAQASERGYLSKGKLKAIYTKNKKIVPYEEEVNDGDVVGIIVPIVGG